jgi:hypothetical protein
MLLPLAGSLCAGGAGAATPSTRSEIGPTSRASIAISVSVRPQVRLSEALAAAESRQTATAAPVSPRDICLVTGSGNYRLLVQPRDAPPDDDRLAALAQSDAATSVCRSAAGARAASTGFRLPPDEGPGAVPYMLLIAPE